MKNRHKTWYGYITRLKGDLIAALLHEYLKPLCSLTLNSVLLVENHLLGKASRRNWSKIMQQSQILISLSHLDA
jgi:hypothetical protein